jgi:uncharacterized membrane protein YobD (UPF0266 family)
MQYVIPPEQIKMLDAYTLASFYITFIRSHRCRLNDNRFYVHKMHVEHEYMFVWLL